MRQYQAVIAVARAHGFALECLGGNCSGFVRRPGDGREFVVTVPDDASIPETVQEEVTLAVYGPDGAVLEELAFTGLRDAVATFGTAGAA